MKPAIETRKLLPSKATARRLGGLNEGQASIVIVLRRRGDRVTVQTESGAVATVSESRELF